jgi:choline dehydrogenase-like flavoprotein
MVEDLPYPHNRVELSQGGDRSVAIRYRPGDYERRRVERMRSLMKGALAPLRYRRIDETGNNRRIAHACGTCRFGDDPRASVLDRNCRAHGLDNLFVVDSSFFPTSGGTNPSLTIAANALRVAAFLTGRTAANLLSTAGPA